MSLNVPKPVFVIGEIDSFTTALGFSDSETTDSDVSLICGSNNGNVSLYSLSTYRCIRKFDFEKDFLNESTRITSVNQLGSSLLLQCKSNNLFLVNQDELNYNLIKRWKMQTVTFSQYFLLNNQFIAFLSESSSNQITLFDLKSSTKVIQLNLKSKDEIDHGVVMSIYILLFNVSQLFTSKEKQSLYIIVAYEDGFFILYRVSLKTFLSETFDQMQNESINELTAFPISKMQFQSEMTTCMDFCNKTMCGISCSVNKDISIWNLNLPEQITANSSDLTESRKQISELHSSGKLGFDKRKTISVCNDGIYCCSIRPDGRIFATGGKDGRIRLFGLRTGKPLAVMAYHSNAIESIRFSHNLATNSVDSETTTKYLLVASSRDQSISLWSVYNN